MVASTTILRARWRVRPLVRVVLDWLFVGVLMVLAVYWMGEGALPAMTIPLAIAVADFLGRVRRRQDREPVLEIDDDGVLDTRVGTGRIRWCDIEEVRRCRHQIWIGLRPEATVDDASRLRDSIWTRPLTARSRRGVLVTARELDVPEEEIEAAIRERAPEDALLIPVSIETPAGDGAA